ncbi:nucleotidyltransferase family protein [bacterium]|nr:nucleotidyltransferase family protein [bacterium]MBU0899491.1 nucleotidyltransferase family protein [bacterium]MBU1154187.1 nucleotidyltransferase family protein [bacterium]
MRNKISIERIKEILVNHKKDIKEKYSVKEIGIFGSYVRGEEKQKSDLDVLVEFDDSIDFFLFLELEEYLAELIGVKVDLVMKKVLKPRIGIHILEEVVYV